MSVIIDRIKKRITKLNKNCVILICGGLGTGKSLSAIKIARAINPNFDLNTHLVFRAKAFMDLINSGKLKAGDVIVWDECGVEFGARDWQSIMNKAINYLLQTFRHLNLALIVTVPATSFVDISIRRLCHYYFETAGINYKEKICTLKPFEVEVNPRWDKVYMKYPRTRDKDGRIIKLTRLNVELVDQETVEEYEKLKQKFTKELNIRLGKAIDRVEEKRKGKQVLSDEECVKLVKSKIRDKNKRTIHGISALLGISQYRARKIRALCGC